MNGFFRKAERSTFPSSYDAYKGLQKKMAKWEKKKKTKSSKYTGGKNYTLTSYNKVRSSNSVAAGARRFQNRTFSKRHLLDSTYSPRDGNTLHFIEVTNSILQGDAINNRLRQTIYVKGMKVALYVQNRIDSVQNLRWCVLTRKGFTPTPDLNADFYTGTGPVKYVDFSSVANGLHHMTYPLNRDKWHVFAQGTRTLGQNSNTSTATSSGQTNSWVQMVDYIPIGKEVEYEGDSVGLSGNPIYFCYWFVDPSQNSTGGVSVTGETRLHTITYFTDAI